MNIKNLFSVGFNHLLAPVACREKAAVPETGLPRALADLAAAGRLEETVLLSTCSRMELYGFSADPEQAIPAARRWFLERGGPEIEACLVSLRGQGVLTHLFRVSSGLDSWIIGESEILGQVRRAYEASRGLGRTGPVLNRVFQSAVAAGKAARARTGIQNGIHSIGGAAAILARAIFGETTNGMTVVFGAGEAAQTTARHLAAKSFSRVFVANRTLEKAVALARPFGGTGVDLAAGLRLLAEAEIAVFSTSCPNVLDASTLRRLAAGRRRPLFLIDVGMPRNVEPACAKIEGVYLYNLDDLKGVVARSIAGKAAHQEQAEVLVKEAVLDCALQLDKAAARARADWSRRQVEDDARKVKAYGDNVGMPKTR